MDIKGHEKKVYILAADLIICSAWLLLLVHEEISNSLMNPLTLLFPTLRIWVTFLMQRQSKLMMAPLLMLSLMGVAIFWNSDAGYILFIEPLMKLLTSVSALFGVELVVNADNQGFINGVCKYTIPINLISYIWLVIIPWGMFIYYLYKKQLQRSSLNVWKAVGLCVYIIVAAFADTILMTSTYKTTLAVAVLALMLLLMPLIFYRGNIKDMLNKSEIAYFLTLAMFAVGYVCGIGLELKSAVTVCAIPAAFYVLMNWYFDRETTFRDILLIVCASIVFWCAQYTTNIVRFLLLLASLGMIAIPVIRFAIDTKKNWVSVGLYIMVALITPVFCLGYNPYSVWEAKREWHFDKYVYSKNGLLYVSNGDVCGLRDRYGVILPLEYNRVELIEPSKPYCKVRKEGVWQIYDIERHELVKDTLTNFFFSDDYELQARDPHAYWLMDCMMQKSVDVENAQDNWAWMHAMNARIGEYNERLGRKIGSPEIALLAIEELLDVYCNGSQAEMNTAAYVFNVMTSYKVTLEYSRFINSLEYDDKELGKLYFKEYCEWYNMYQALYGLMCNYTYALARHSARSMEINGISEAWLNERLELLKKEYYLLCFGEKDAVMTSGKHVDMQEFILLVEYYKGRTGQALIDETGEEGYDYELVLQNVTDFETAFAAWSDVRGKIASILPEDRQQYYKSLTAHIQVLTHRYLNDLKNIKL